MNTNNLGVALLTGAAWYLTGSSALATGIMGLHASNVVQKEILGEGNLGVNIIRVGFLGAVGTALTILDALSVVVGRGNPRGDESQVFSMVAKIMVISLASALFATVLKTGTACLSKTYRFAYNYFQSVNNTPNRHLEKQDAQQQYEYYDHGGSFPAQLQQYEYYDHGGRFPAGQAVG